MTTNVNIMELTQLTKLIGRIGKRGMQIHSWIQQAAVQAVAHSIVHGNVQPGNQLLDAMTGGHRKDSLVKYLEKFGNFAWLKADKKLGFFQNKRDGKPIEWNAEYAMLCTNFDWAKAKAEPVIRSVYDVEAMLEQLIDNAHRAVKKQMTIRGGETLSKLEGILYGIHQKQYMVQAEARADEAKEAKEAAQTS